MRKKKEKQTDNSFSIKNLPKKKSLTHHSILQMHEEKITSFKKKDIRLKNIDIKIKNLSKDLESLNKEMSIKTLNNEHTFDTNIKIDRIESEIKELKESFNYIKSGEDELKYTLDSCNLIMQFYQLLDREQELLNKQNLSFEESNELNNIVCNKNSIADEYFKKFNPNYNFQYKHNNLNFSLCLFCNINMEYSNGFLVCNECGICRNTLETNGELSYKEMQDYDYRPQFTYDKMTHLEDWLRRFQSKENRIIPQEVLDKVIVEAKKERINDLSLLSEDKVKKYLKKLNLNEYYDNIIGIINRINGRPPFTLTTEIEEKIKTMFQQIQEPFEKYKPNNRKNFLSYSYTLHKFFQILGLDEFSKYFPLLKSPDKLRQQDEIFKKVVAEMALKDKTINWKFYPSI